MQISISSHHLNPGVKSHQCLLIDQYTEQSDIAALLAASGSYMLKQKEATEIIDEVRGAVKDWRRVASELQIPNKTLAPYCGRWDNL